MRLTLTFILTLTSLTCFCQDTIDIKYYGLDDTINVYQCKLDSEFNLFVVQENVLDLNYDFLVFDYIEKSTIHNNVIEYKIEWPSNFIDGSFYLVVNPRQMYLITGHDNPNSDFLCWVKNINFDIYKKIVQILNCNSVFSKSEGSCGDGCEILFYTKYLSELKIPDEWSDSEIIKHQEDYEQKLYKNFSNIIGIINKGLLSFEQIIIPDQNSFKKQKRLTIIDGLYDLDNHPKKMILKID